MKQTIDKEYVKREVSRLDPKVNIDSEDFKVATILLASAVVGADTKKIAKFLTLSEKEVKKYEKNLRRAKIWVGNKVGCEWFDKKHGGVAFWCDVCVAEGLIKRVETESGKSGTRKKMKG